MFKIIPCQNHCQNQDGASEDDVTQLTLDTFERLPSEYTKPAYDYFQSESTTVENQS